MSSFTLLDIAIAGVLAIALIRGFFVGMIREGFSLAAIGAAVLAARYGAGPAGDALNDLTGGEIGPAAAKWVGGFLCGAFGAVLVAAAGRWLRRGARVVGLGMADRLGGLLVGGAEGALVGALLITGVSTIAGRDHPVVYNAYSVAVFDEVRYAIETGEAPDLPDLPDVASGPAGRSRSR